MDNPEEIMQSLEEFAKMKPRDIPKELEEYIGYVAKTGDPVYQWNLVKYLFHEKLLSVITEFYETSPLIDIPPCPNVDPFNYERMKTNLIERLDNFTNAPFTIQRLCELLSNPKKQYNRVDKFMRAIEKNILVVSTIDPGFGKRFENDHCYESNSVMNGIPDGQVNDNDKVYYVTKDIISYVKYMQRPYEENETNSVNQEQGEVGKSDSTGTVDDVKSDSQTNTEIDKKLPEVTVGTSMENSENIISTSGDSETSVTNSASSNDEVNKEAGAENEVDSMIVSEVSDETATLDSSDKLNSPNESIENISADDKNNEETDSKAESEENVETEATADKSTLVDNLQSTDEISEPKPSTNDQGTEIQEELLEASDNPEIKISTEEKPVDTTDLRPSTETEQTDSSDKSCTVDEGQIEAETKEESNFETEKNSTDEPECSNSELPEEAEAKESDDITSSNSVTDSSDNTENSVTIQEVTSNTEECNDAEELITKEVVDEDLAENESKKDEPVIEPAEDSTISPSSDITIDDKTTVSIEEVTEMGESKTEENVAAESMNDVTEDICEERKEGSIIHTTTNVSGVAVQSVVEDICVDQPSCDAPEEEAMEVDESSLQPMIVSEVENEGEPMDQSEQVQS